MKIHVEGSVYDFDLNKLLVSEAIFIKDKTGLMFRAWQQALSEGDPLAMKALVFIMQRRAGESPEWDTLDFDLASIDVDDDEPVSEVPSDVSRRAAASPKEDVPAA